MKEEQEVLEPELSHLQFIEEDNEEGRIEIDNQTHRSICRKGCDRPTNTCLCPHLPQQPIPTSTHLLILQHPHERRHKLSTAPILTKCLSNAQIVLGRRLTLGSSPLLDALHAQSTQQTLKTPKTLENPRALILFPDAESVKLTKWASTNRGELEKGGLVLIVFDGTWNHAREMARASEGFLRGFATRVCLDFDVGVDGGSVFDSELVLRKEPFGGCVSTVEAVARALRVLEVCGGGEIEERMVGVLRAMVGFQAGYLKEKDVRARTKMGKKNGKEKRGI
ncbi:hypothetical protein Sjap_012810 [Stephania japonica]|uniref:tRNA-uridine aminocarboxypropyltransferase n=1 Tax=Stephania japonica TaxID=461633 RepID=A0AAP0IWW4_9MAGN